MVNVIASGVSYGGQIASLATTMLAPHKLTHHSCAWARDDGFRGVYHRARIRATRWLYPSCKLAKETITETITEIIKKISRKLSSKLAKSRAE
jgi:hypothetical protein